MTNTPQVRLFSKYLVVVWLAVLTLWWVWPVYAGTGRNSEELRGTPGNSGELIIPSSPSKFLSVPLVPSLAITATKSYTLATDGDGDNQADPGDVLSYTIVITNNGVTTNTGVIFSDTLDPNTGQVGLVSISPIAFDDNYNAITNPLTLTVPDGLTDTFANDYPGLNPAVSGITSFGGGSLGGAVTTNAAGSTVPIPAGGSLTVNANGSFDFTPAVGFQGVFTFFYRLQNPVGPGDGLVSLMVDAPPSVISTSPISGATGITATTNITVTFSESVAYNASSFTLACPSGSPVAFSLASTSPSTSAVLNPTANLPPGVVCAVTVLAGQISDVDANDPPDNMLADYSFTFGVAPDAIDDTYAPQIIGNVGISTTNSTNFSLLTNDQGPGLTITAFGATSAQGGTVGVITSTGTFSYTPPAGFEGSDSFTYTIGNAAGSDTATVNLTVAGMIWFVNNNAGGGGDGRLNTPYNTLADFQADNDGAGNNPAANDHIFLHESATAYTGGVTLLNGQRLIGQDATVTLAAATGLTVPADSFPLPVTNSGNGTVVLLNSAATAIALGSGNTIRGLTVGDTTANDISGTNFGTLTVLDTTLTGAGRALDLNNGTLNATFNGVTSTSGANNVNLVSVSGTANLGSGALSGATGTAFNVNGGNATITYAGNVTQNNAQRVVEVQNSTGGAINFTTGTVTGGASSTGVNINNANGNVSFANLTLGTSGSRMTNQAVTITGGTGTYSLGNVSIFTNNAQGIVATNADGTLNSTSGAVDTGTATAINLDGPAGLTTLGMTLTSVTSSGGSATGIIIQDTNGSFTVNGDGTNTNRGGNGSGGVIANKNDGGSNGSGTVGAGVFLNNASGITLRRMQLNDHQNYGIRGTNITNFVLQYSTVNGANGDDTPTREGSVIFDNVFGGSNSIFESVISGAIEDNVRVENSSSTALTSFNISNNNIQNNSSVSGNIGFRCESRSSANMTVVVNNNNFSGNRTDTINCNGSGTSQLNITVSNNIITRGSPNDGNIGINITADSSGQVTYDIDNNRVGTPDGSTDQSLLNTGINVFAGNTSTMNGQVRNNRVINRGAGVSGIGIRLVQATNSTLNVNVDNNTVSNVGLDFGIQLDAGQNAGATGFCQIAVTDNTVSVLGGALDAIRVRVRNASTGCSRITGNTATHPGAVNCTLGGAETPCLLSVSQGNTAVHRLEGGAAGLAAGNPGIPSNRITTFGTITTVAAGFCSSIP